MTTIATGLVPATALSGGTNAHVLVMADGRRVVLYTDGTDLFMKHSLNGTSWSSPITAIAGQASLPATLIAVSAGAAVHIYRASGSSVTCTRVPYSPGGTFGAPVTATIGTAQSAPSSLRAVFDPDGITTDSQHTGGTGIVHLLLDEGLTWEVWACDPHTAAAAKPKVVSTASVPLPVLAPAANADLCLRRATTQQSPGNKTANLYALGSGSATDGWAGVDLAYTTLLGTGGVRDDLARPIGIWDHTLYQDQVVTSPTYGDWFYGDMAAGTAWAIRSDQAAATPDRAGQAWGWTLPASGNQVFSGTWTVGFDLNWNISYPSGEGHPILRVYQVQNGVKTLRGTLAGPASAIGAFTWWKHFEYSGTIPAFTTGPDDVVYVEVALAVDTRIYFASMVQYGWDGSSVTGVFVTAPAGVVAPSAYHVGALERPTLPAVPQGATVISDGSGGVDILLNGGGTLRACNRTPQGAYQPVLPVAVGLTAGVRPAGSVNGRTGIQAAIVHESSHIWAASRLSGAWGAMARVDTAGSAVLSAFAAVEPTALGLAGKGIAYLDGAGPYDLIYEDAGFAAGAVAPAAPLLSLVPHASTADSNTSPSGAVTTSLLPLIRVIFQSTGTAPMGAITLVVYDDTAAATVWDSGVVALANGPTNGAAVDIEYDSLGATATPLTPGHQYTLTATAYDAAGGSASTGATLVFHVFDPVSVTAISPDVYTNLSQAIAFTPAQTDSVPLTAYRLHLTGPSGTVTYDSGVVAAAMTSGVPVTPTLTLAGHIRNGVGYLLTVTVYAQPAIAGLPAIAGVGTLPVIASIPTCDVPTIDSAAWINGTTPFNGGVAEVVYHETTGAIPAIKITIYEQSPAGSGPWVQIEERPVPAASDTIDLWDLNNRETAQVGLTATSADDVESGMAITDPITAQFYYGIWVTQRSDPTIRLELGLIPKDSPDLGWDPTGDIDDAELFDRGAVVTSVGTLWYRTSTELTYTLPRGYEEAMTLQMEAWNRDGTTVLVKDPDGLTHACRVLKAARTHVGTSKHRALTASFKEVDI